MYQYFKAVRYVLFAALLVVGIFALSPRVSVSEPLGNQIRQSPTNSYAGRTTTRDPLGATIELSGTLMVRWGDPADPQLEALVLYDFFAEDGTRYRLDADSLRRAYGDDPQSLNRQFVTVTVLQAELASRRDSDRAVQVQTIRTNPKQGRSTDAPQILMKGNLPYISVLCAFPDGATPFKPLSYYKNMYGNSYPFLDHYWREQSYNTVSVEGSTAIGPFTLPHSQAYYGYEGEGPDLDGLAEDCLAAAGSSADFSLYYGINLMFNHGSLYSWGGSSCSTSDGVESCSGMTWLAEWGWSNLKVVEHEMGHSFWLPHSVDQFGNFLGQGWDVMGGWTCLYDDSFADYGCLGPHTIAHFKAWLGWIPPSKIFNAIEGSNNSIRIERLAKPATDDYQLVRIPHLSRRDLFYTLEARHRVGHDKALSGDGVIIHKITGESDRYYPGLAQVVDGDGNGNTWDDGATWTVGETFSDPSFGVSVKVVAADATGYTVDVTLTPPPAFTDCSDQDSIPVAECLALTALYDSTGGTEWSVDTTWLLDNDPCYWIGVTCSYNSEATNEPYYNVTDLELESSNLIGILPPELGNLDKLLVLWLGSNQLSGPLPARLGDLENLAFLFLDDNQLSGPLPAELGGLENLSVLDLSSNQLSGSLPAELGDLENLSVLVLNNNQLSGSLPAELGNLDELWVLSLGSNQLSGSLPAELGDLENLVYLSLNDNQLSGPLPAELGTLDNLGDLILDDNQLSGPLPAELGDLENLGALGLSNNQFSGSIPPELSNLEYLGVLSLHDNQLSGPVPAGLGKLEGLSSLDLSNNQLSGSLPAELGNLNWLRWLKVNNNPLLGQLPPELMQLALETFDFSGTGLCEPADRMFQTWLESIPSLNRTSLECVPSLQVDFADGAPGSYFNVYGTTFKPNAAASVSANGIKIGNIQADANGDLAFRLSTSSADEGFYSIEVVAGSDQATASILLDLAASLRPLSGSMPEITLPAGIAMHRLFLPFATDRP